MPMSQFRPNCTILAIESSCDETSAAIYAPERRLLVQETYTQIALHAQYGGVVPELAARSHLEKLYSVVEHALSRAELTLDRVDAIAYTRGPGLVGPLLIGASYADALSYARQLPLLPVHHLEAHITIPLHAFSDLDFPFIALLVSGGHTELIYARDLGQYELLGSTLDDAAGEAFDKCGKMLGIDYPAGPQLAANADAYTGNTLPVLPTPLKHRKTLDFSFSGLKTAFSRLLDSQRGHFSDDAFACAVQKTIVDALVTRLALACDQITDVPIVVAGGVAANSALRRAVDDLATRLGRRCYFPDIAYCTDNAAMIAHNAYLRWQRFGVPPRPDHMVQPRWPIS
jgi:N6-L-threonylcarbamoyladenine synthase